MIDINKAKQKILDLAIRGKLTKQLKSDDKAADLIFDIQKEKEKQNIGARKTRPYTVGASCASPNADNDSEMPFEIPGNWAWCKLGEVTAIERGGSPRPIKAFITSDENGTNWIKIGDVEKNGKYITKVKEKIIKDGEKHSRKVFPGDFLLTNSMSFGRPYISKIEGCIHDGWLVIRGNDNIYTSEYLYYYLSSAFAFNQFSESASGATVDNLSIDKVKSSWFSLPPLAEQKRIVEKVDKLFEILDKINEAQKKYQKDKDILKSKIIEAGIRGKLTKQLKSDGDAKDLYDKIQKEKEKLIKEGKIKRDKKETYIYKKSSDKLYYEKYQDGTEKCINDELPFKISENWTWAKFSNVCDIATGTSIPKKVKDDKYLGLNKGYCYLGTKDVGFDHKIIYENSVKIPKGEKGFEIAPENSVLLCIEGGSAGRKIGIIDRDVCYGNKLCKFYSHSLNQRYIYYFLQSDTFKSIFKNNLTGLIEGVSISSINNLLIPLPPMKEQERIAKVIEKILSIINN